MGGTYPIKQSCVPMFPLLCFKWERQKPRILWPFPVFPVFPIKNSSARMSCGVARPAYPSFSSLSGSIT